MKSSDSNTETASPAAIETVPLENTFLLQSPFFALLAVLIPFSILASLLPLAVLLLQRLLPQVFFPLSFWFGFALFSAITASIYWAVVKRSKADHGAANIRGGILMLILCYTLGSLFRFELPLTMRFFPSLFNIPTALISLFIWFPVLGIKHIFSGQELFESNIRLYEGEKLRQIMLEDSSLMSEADGDIKKLITYYRIFFLPPLVLIFLCGALNIPIRLSLGVSLFFLFTFGASIIGFLSFLRREYAYAAEGLTLPYRPRALVAAVLVVLAAAGGGVLVASNRSLLSPGLIADLFRRLLAFLESLRRPIEEPPPLPPEPQVFQPPAAGLPPEFLEAMGETEPSAFWDWVKYGALVFVAFLFLMFMIQPLLGRNRLFQALRSLLANAPAFLSSWLKAMIQGLSVFISSLKEGRGGKYLRTSPSAATLRRLEEDLLEGYSPAKRRDLARSIGLFARLIYWGSEVLKVSWKPSHAPAEYCRLLAAAANAHAVTILRAGELFEKALYAPGPLSRKEREEFKDLVERITA